MAGPIPAETAMTVPGDRHPRTEVPARLLESIQHGVMRTRYRGLAFLKSPFDVVLYLQLIERMRPHAVIEIGTKEGGSALWFADTMRAYGLDGRVISVDIEASPHVRDERITFLEGDATCLGDSALPDELDGLPHPWLVTEDSAHRLETSLAVLEFFDPLLQGGDYIVIEDGVVGSLPGEEYERYENGPTRALAAFLATRGNDYEVDTALCDFFGTNVTYNPNGWLRRR